MVFNINKINKKTNAFSLVEVLISLVILSLIMVALAPIITKKVSDRVSDGVVYTYSAGNNVQDDNVCFVTEISNYSSFTEKYTSTRECSEYQFVVPKDVYKVNLTLVAGGGGGGGAAGGKTLTKTLSTNDAQIAHVNADGFIPDILKEVKIKSLVSKGQNGFPINKDCNGGGNYVCSGKGGNSSMAIVEFPLPDAYTRGSNFSNNLSTSQTNAPQGRIRIAAGETSSFEVENSKNGVFDGSRKIEYGIRKTDDGYKGHCALGGINYDMGPAGVSACGITSQFIIDSIKGENGRSDSKNASLSFFTYGKDMVFVGGIGGIVNGTSSYGSGGVGASMKLECKKFVCNNISDLTLTQNKAATEGESAHAEAEYTIEYPGGTGGGGGGGTGVKIMGLDVLPGQKYIIRVGKGGKGGSGAFASQNPKQGENGVGGVSTAIYNENGQLIYMVNGGAPGQGGRVYNGSAYTGQIGASGRYFPKVFSGIDNLTANIVLDQKVASKSNVGDANSIPSVKSNANLSKVNIQYPYMSADPYYTLNYKVNTNSINIDSRTGGFSAFDTNNTVNEQISYNGSNINNVYNGFYYRNLKDNLGAYVGGLGGFSGVSKKAGCGGYFLGNFDGRTSTSNKDFLVNTFVVERRLYPISAYYENCNSMSPNGTTAEFVAPTPNSSKFGSAGSGGGGGGYNILAGSGRGGDGQDGYLMIEWRK